MTGYRAILFFYSKNHTVAQIATLCGCSSPTVYKIIMVVIIYQILLM